MLITVLSYMKVFWHWHLTESTSTNIFSQELVRLFIHFQWFAQAEVFFSAFVPHDAGMAAIICQVHQENPHLGLQLTRLLALSANSLLRSSSNAVSSLLMQQSQLLLRQVI